jgi:mannose-6-phosphate isomerase-like protein (cupin superfamily)
MENNRFHLDTFLSNEKEVFHVARTTINYKDDLQLHKHRYAEVLWIKSGNGIHHINGEEVSLKKGTLCMIRPNDSHTFKLGKNQDSLVVTNIAFNKDSLHFFKERYFPDSDSYFWSNEKLPFCIQLEMDHLNELSAIADRLLSQPHDYIHLDYIIINIFRLINAIEGEQLHIPHWLAFALENFNTPDKFNEGIQGFVALTNRSVDHVNRVLQSSESHL